MKLEIKNLKLDYYNLNLTINNNEKIGVFSRNPDYITRFLWLVSGINKNNNSIFYNENNVFDNEDYFKERIYFDFSKKYLTTLKTSKIESQLKYFNLEFNKDRFSTICKELNIRGETDITYKYEFSKIGNTFLNLALACSLNKKNLIINAPLSNLNLKSDFTYFVEKLTSFNNIILGLDNLLEFKGKLDKIIFFSDFYETVIMSNNDTFIVFDKEIDKSFLIKNKIYQNDKVIIVRNYTKDDIKNWQKQKIKFELISIYDINKYLGEI